MQAILTRFCVEALQGIPDVDDEVLVGFVTGDLDGPVAARRRWIVAYMLPGALLRKQEQYVCLLVFHHYNGPREKGAIMRLEVCDEN